MKLRSSVQSLPRSLSLGKVCRHWSHPWDTGTATCLEMHLWAPFFFISALLGGVAEEQVSPGTVEGQLVLCQWVQPPWWLQELAGMGAQAQGSPAALS